jgi:glycosyltransferase involved in cell wall biosynthesis
MLLTIGIPTLNESRLIVRTLQSILSQIDDFITQVEIVIVDNGSVDGTIELANNFISTVQLKNLQFRIIENEANLGFSFSCDEIIRQALGEYVWILGAHDKIHINSLSQIIGLLQTAKPQNLILNATVFDEKTSLTLNESIYRFDRTLIKNQVITVNSRDAFFKVISGPCVSVSLNITEARTLKQAVTLPLETKYWGYVQRICDALISSSNSVFAYLDIPSVEIMLKYDGWQYVKNDTFGPTEVLNSHTSFYIDMDLAYLAKYRYKDIDYIANGIGVWKDPIAIVRSISLSKFAGLRTNKEILIKSYNAYRSSYWYWLAGLPLLLIPTFILRPAMLVQLRGAVHWLRRIFKRPAR